MTGRKARVNGSVFGGEEVVRKLLSGKKKPRLLEKEVFGGARKPVELAAGVRRQYLGRKYGFELKHVASTVMDYEDAGQKNIENMIGAVQIPLSYVEVLVEGEYAEKGKQYVVYLATTEGRLVAGVSRGVSAINASGGTKAFVLNNAITRSDIITTQSIGDSIKIAEFTRSSDGNAFLKSVFESSSRHCEFIGVEPITTGRLLFLRYKATTKAAMGMNMVTIASSATTEKLVEKMRERGMECRFASESGNIDSDKKPSMVNVIKGRGISIVAEAVISKKILKRILGVDPERIVEINYLKNYVGSSLAGTIAHNAHIANVLAATFIAYGQDVAQIVDGVTAFDDACITEKGDLYFSIYIPALEVGTYGGGTGRETQKELLKSSGVYGEGDEEGRTKLKLAELIASVCLAAELNVLAAESTGNLAAAHASLQRG